MVIESISLHQLLPGVTAYFLIGF